MTTTPPRIAVIGAGAWGTNHVRAVSANTLCELALVVDHDPAACARAHALAGVRTSVAVDQALSDPRIDAVMIATPAPTHVGVARAALEAGKHVLVEKPVALSVADARELAAIAARTPRVLMVGHLMVFHPAVVRLRELLQSGALGRLHYVHSIRANLGRIRQDENALWSFGPHELSMLDFLLERSPVNVAARGQCVLQKGIEDVVFLTLRYADGEIAHLHLSWLHPRKERRLTLVCAQKMVEFDDVAREKLRIYDKGYDRPPAFTQFAEYLTIRDGDVHIPQLSLEEPLQLQLAHFIDCITGHAKPITDVASGLRTVRILEAAQESLRRDGVPVSCAP